jgi:hypothetical protein
MRSWAAASCAGRASLAGLQDARLKAHGMAVSCCLPDHSTSSRPTKYRPSISTSSLFIIHAFDQADEIADDLDLIGIVVRNLNVGKFILDQYHQFKATEPIEAEIVAKVRFICNPFGINACVLGNESAHLVGIKILLWRGWLSWAQATESHNDAPCSLSTSTFNQAIRTGMGRCSKISTVL